MEEAFALPDEDLTDNHALARHQAEIRRHRLKKEKMKQKYDSVDPLIMLDTLTIHPLTSASLKRKKDRCIKLSAREEKIRRAEMEGKIELATVKNVVKRKVLDARVFDASNDDKESSLDHPKLNSIEEKLEDLRHEDIEKWCVKHGRVAACKLFNHEKRVLRRWFKEIDVDGSGEVTADELQDAMLSSGIFKTREQVVRILSNIDKNQTNGIDFEEFLQVR